MKLQLAAIKILISFYLASGTYVVRKAPQFGHNVCIMGKNEAHVTLKRKLTSSRKTLVKDCGILPGPIIDCEEHIIQTVISYVPVTKTNHVSKIACCPGFKDYIPFFGCLKRAPCLSLPQHTPFYCVAKRHVLLNKNRKIYKLNKPPRVPAGIQTYPNNFQNFFLFPLVNLTAEQAAALSSRDPEELPWLITYRHLLTKSIEFLKEQVKPHSTEQFNNTADFYHLLQHVRTLFTKDGKYLQYFRYPSLVEKFKDIIHCDMWQDDQVFVEQRLAALNPMSLQLVTTDEDFFWKKVGLKLSDLRKRLNRNFNWDNAISSIVGRRTTLEEMVHENSVFAVHFPYLDELTNVPDVFPNIPGRKLKNSTSPIALFVSVKLSDNKPYELKPVAIQINSRKYSPVYTPSDGKRWLLAKQLYQLADFAYGEMIEHLLKTHLILQPICVIAKRTISIFHPLNELLKWHCRGLISTNVNGLPKLLERGGYMHRLFSMGHVGSIELLNKGYMDFSWKDTDFWENIKKRGVDDLVKLPYFPYRDDGFLIWQQIRRYVEEYVSLYYGTNKDVQFDAELINFTNQLSRDGTGETGGMGMLKGFPRRLFTKSSLIETVSRILWLPVQHNAVNYPIAYYGAFVPNMPTKLYDDPRGKPNEYSFYSLPGINTATVQAVVSMSLGSLRFDSLLAYGPKMVDYEAGQIVQKHHRILTTKIKTIIDERNNERFKNGHLTYPYLKPGWIPNSIHT